MVCSTPSCQSVVEKVVIVNYTNAWFSISNLLRTDQALLEVIHGPGVTREYIFVTDPHTQLVIRVDKLLPMSHPIKGDSTSDIDAGSDDLALKLLGQDVFYIG